MSNEQSPWAQPDPRWRPQSYHDAKGRDPRQPFGGPQPGLQGNPPHQPTIEDFREQGTGGPPWWLVVVGIVAAIAVVLVALQIIGGEQEALPSATPSASTSPQDEETPGSSATGGNAIPFEGHGTGVFELLSQRWTADGLEVEFRVTLDAGEQSYSLYMFNNSTMEVADPVDTAPFYVSADTPYTGSARFYVEQTEGTLVLTTGFGRALTALPVKG